jgi:hypothetical protein
MRKASKENMTRPAFDLYGHQLLAPEDADKYPLANHWYQTTKNWLDKITAGMLPAAKKQVTQVFIEKNNRDWHTKNGFIDQTHSANIDARKKAQELQKLHDTNLHNSLKAVYGEKSVYVTDNLSEWATTHASECLDIIRNNTADELDEKELPAVAKLARLYIQAQGIDAPRISKGFEYSALLKAISPKWWELKGTRAVIQMRERWFIGLGFVQAKNTPYISKEGLAWSNTKQAQQLEYLEQFELANDFGDVVEMRDMWESSSSHPEKRRTELMVRLRGMNTVAKDNNWQCDFVTLTAPSKYHGCSRKWNGASPKDAQAYLCRIWALIRTAMQDAEIERFGVRVTEPHHDGTPHWHLLIFGTRKNLRAARKIIKHYAYLEDGDEKGADENRCDFKRMNPAKGDAVGYIAKYISKNINAKHIENEDDLELNEQGETAPLSDSVKRVQAWARVWRIRQFQFFGAPSVTVWRELRRYKEEVPKEVQPLWEAADRGEWDKFHQLFDSYQPELLKDKTALNEYAECYPSIRGVVVSGFALLTRLTEWAKRKKRGDSPATRSTVPNCRSTEKKQMTMPLEWYLWGQDKGITPRNIPAFRLMEV